MLSVIFGIVGIVVGILWLVNWGAWAHFLVVLQGSLPPFLILVGAVAVAAGISSVKDNMEAKKEEEKVKSEKPEGKKSEKKEEKASKKEEKK
ncbi:MAG: hypothetical protein ACQESB_04620 [Elusimicrobiota bacterium]